MRSLPTPTLVTVAELRRNGLSEDDIRAYVRGWHRVRRGIFTPTWPESPHEQHLVSARAVLIGHRTGTVLSHVTGALAWGLPVMVPDPGPVVVSRLGDLTVPDKRSAGLRVIGSPLDRRDVVVIDGMPVTSAVRTVLDCARSLPKRVALAVADAAAHADLLPDAEMQRVLSQMKGWKGIPRARAVLPLVEPATESPGETFCRVALLDAGFRVTAQYEVVDRGRFIGRADFWIDRTRVLVEFDGRSKYSLDPEGEQMAVWKEKRRHDALEAVGFAVVRLSWEDLSDKRQLRLMVERAIARAEQRHGHFASGW